MLTNVAAKTARRFGTILPLLLAAFVGLLLTGCSLNLNSSEPTPTAVQAQPTPQGQTEGQAQGQPASQSSGTTGPTATVVIPGMPVGLCGGSPPSGSTDTPTAEPSAEPTASPTAGPTGTPVAPFQFYCAGTLATGWSDASWGGAKADFASKEAQRDGKPTIKVSFNGGWSAFGIADWNKANLADASKYSHLHFWVNGGSSGGQIIGAMLYTNGGTGQRLHVEKYIKSGKIPANAWQEVFIPLEDLEASGLTVERVVFQEVTGKDQPPFYLDGIELWSDNRPPPTPVVIQAQITVDLGKDRKPISPYIYGTSLATEDVVKDANISINRLGGNPYSRYNWTLGNARNAGSDWEYRNYSRENTDPGYKQPSGLADMFYKANKRAGADTILTVPILGYVAKNDDQNTMSTGVPEEGGDPVSPGSEAIRGYNPSHNQQVTSVKSHARKGSAFADPPSTTGDVFQDEWINHLTRTFGKSADGGVRFYAMDNEPDLWADNTHVDVHPVRPGYDDTLHNFLEYAQAVKAVDPTSQVTGPVVSGWTGYWYSARDRGGDAFRTHADRNAHGGTPLIPWFLDQVHRADQASGTRTLDVLDIHYYPQAQGVMQDKVDAATSALRLRSTRSLWDPTYKDESWIARTDTPEVNLIPRMKGWIDQYYPDTKLGITEWKWGAEGSMNGALAIADVLGIYGREGVYLANYYTNPPLGSPGLAAFKMYRNYDGHNATFGDVSASAQSNVPDKLAVYASEDTHTGQLKLIAINKADREEISASISLQGAGFKGPARVYGLSAATGLAIKPLPDASLSGSSLSYSLPPYSVTLIVVDKAR